MKKALQLHGYEKLFESCGIEGLIVLGGGGSLEAAAKMAQAGARIVGIPCTIDNDVPGTDYCLGFDSAVNKALRSVDEILDTAESLSDRVFLVETMGGNTGHIALANCVLRRGRRRLHSRAAYGHRRRGARIRAKMDSGGTHGLAIVCEDMGTNEIAEKLEAGVGRKVRLTVLGHIQRGGNPTFFDRRTARQFGEAAVEMILSGQCGRMVTCAGDAVHSMPLANTVGKSREIDLGKYRAVNGLA